MVKRTAGWRSRETVKGRLQAALYWNRKSRIEKIEPEPEPEPQPPKEDTEVTSNEPDR
ncbi:hypothetical protein PQD76_gp01 [Stenotrophomonas phage BUCT626]|nr:hypothetical protein PQD76_gp01 [Stenotrophomonas phage BUCT626]QYC96705.1 hypothetical protein [Stenotrophomonas phage BUCT626]